MVARRTFLGWISALPAGTLGARALIACDDGGSGSLDTSPDTLAPDTSPDTLAPDTLAPDTSPETLAPDVGPRTCPATTPDALGPYYRAGAPAVVDLAGTEPGTPLSLSGEVTDTACRPIPGARIEIWQADAAGDYHDDRLRATLTADAAGRYALTSIMPGRYLQASGYRPAHLHLRVSAPGYATLVTQIYFVGDPYLQPNDSCPPCASDDPARILALDELAGRMVGTLPLALAAS